MDPLARIAERLKQGEAPHRVAAEMVPHRPSDALWWVRRLPLFCEHHDPRVAAVARIIGTRAMRRHGLTLERDGTISSAVKQPPQETPLACEGASVAYAAQYFPGKDHYQFTGLRGAPIPFTGGEHFSHFADPDAVAALGGPDAYLAALVAAIKAGTLREFEAQFQEPWPEVTRRKVKKPQGHENTLF